MTVSGSFKKGIMAGMIISLFFWPACRWVDHQIGSVLHALHGGENHGSLSVQGEP